MVKKFFCLLAIMVMVIGVFSSACLAGESSDISNDKDYPELGMRFHSWVTGYGSETVAHTQEIDIATGKVIKQLDKKCNYEDTPYVTDTQGWQ